MSDFDQPPQASRLEELLAALTQQRLTEEEGRELNEQLKADPAARLAYLRAVDQEVSLRRLLRAFEDAPAVRSTKWLLRLQAELDDDTVSEARPAARPTRTTGRPRPAAVDESSERAAARRVTRRQFGRWRWRAAAVLSVGLCGLVIWSLLRSPAPVATLTRSTGAQWDGAAVADGTGLVAGRQLSLSAGVAELSFGQGKATVIVEGPARVTVESATAVSLASGRLAGTVAGGGFRVRTPSTVVTDLGTEFGVTAHTDGSTRVEVFKGKVRAEPVTAGGAPAGASRVLTEGQAATARPTGVDLDPAGAVPQRFVRAIRSRATSLDVVDLVAGGDGTTRRRGLDIDPTSGQTAAPLPATQGRGGDGKYHPVPALPVVDGVFIPDGRRGPVQVSSAGHTFAFPPTDGGSFGQISTVGGVPGAWDAIPQTLGTVNFRQPGHGVIFTHANDGLTLNLDAVRRLYPGRTLARFRCTVAKAERNPVDASRKVDVSVLVDGQARAERRGLVHNVTAVIDVPLGTGDRYLSLAVTDGGDGLTDDGTLWGDPVLDLEAQ